MNHQTAECSIPDCYCHHASRQDAPLVQLPLEHASLKSLTEAERNVRDALLASFDQEWHSAALALRIDYDDACYWYLIGKRHGRQEALELQVSDLREIERLVSGRME